MAGSLKYVLFISYADADSAWVEGFLLPALGLPGESVITKEDFRPGADKVSEFARAVTSSRYTVLVLSPAFVTDVWAKVSGQMAAYLSVDEQRDRLIPLLLQPCTPPLFADSRVALDCTDEAQWEREIARLRDLLDQSEPEPERIDSPYPGMVPFSAEDARFFYGRDTQTRQLLEHLRYQRLLFLIGPSGSGKSSLVFAGLLPGLHQSTLFPQNFWIVRDMRPGSQPTLVLSHLLGSDLARPAETIEALLETHPPAKRLLLIVDQFEEMFTQADRDEQGGFISALQALSSIENCALLIVMRADFYPDLMNSDLWPVVAHQRLEIAPPRGETLRQAIRQPAADVGVYLEAGLLERLMADAADEPGALPLVQETMVLLWSDMRRRLLSLSAYKQLGSERRSGLAVAIARKADATLVTLTPNQRIIARRIFVRLVQFVEGRDDIRRQQPVKALRSAGDAVDEFDTTLEHLTRNRLLTLSGEEQGEDRKVDISHEALISSWPTLQRWLRERGEAEQIRRRLESKTTDWIRMDRRGRLLDEAELSEAERWLSNSAAVDLGCDEALPALIQASRKSHRYARRLRYSIVGTVVALIIAVLSISLFGQYQITQEQQKRVDDQATAVSEIQAERDAAQDARGTAVAALAAEAEAHQIALSRQLAAQSANNLDGDWGLAFVLAIEAGRTADTNEAFAALAQAFAHPDRTWIILSGHTDRVRQAVWNADESRIMTVSDDRTVRVWDAETGAQLLILSGHTDVVNQAVWNADESRILTTSNDRTAQVWDAETGDQLLILSGHASGVARAMWNADESRILTTSDDVRVWDAETGAQLLIFFGYSGNQAVWNADGSRILTAGCNRRNDRGQCLEGTAQIWDAVTGDKLLILSGHTSAVNQAMWNADESRILTVSDDRTVRVWDAETGDQLLILSGHTNAVNQVVWNADESRILTTSNDRTAQVWDAETGDQLLILSGHTSTVNQAMWDADESRILTVSNDRTVRVWDAETGAQLLILFGHVHPVNQAVWNADGSRILTANDDRMARVLGAETGAELVTLSGHTDRVRQAVWNTDESRILTANDDGTARVWDTETGAELLTLSGHTDAVNQAMWNADESRILTASDDRTARVWDAETGAELITLSSHTNAVSQAMWNADESRILTTSNDHTAQVWDAETGAQLLVLSGHTSAVNQAMWNADESRILTASYDGTARVWDTETGAELLTLSGHTDVVNQAVWNADESRILTASNDGTARTWGAETGAQLLILSGHASGVNQAVWNADESRILTAGCGRRDTLDRLCLEGTTWVWDAETGAQLLILSGHTDAVNQAVWNADESCILTASDDSIAQVWDAETGAQLLILSGHTDAVNQAVWNADESRILTTSKDGTVRQWYAGTEDLLEVACRHALRNMTQVEWRQFMKDREYRKTCPELSGPEEQEKVSRATPSPASSPTLTPSPTSFPTPSLTPSSTTQPFVSPLTKPTEPLPSSISPLPTQPGSSFVSPLPVPVESPLGFDSPLPVSPGPLASPLSAPGSKTVQHNGVKAVILLGLGVLFAVLGLAIFWIRIKNHYDFFFQIVMFLVGAVLTVGAFLLSPKSRKRWVIGMLALLLVAISLVWIGYELDIRIPIPTAIVVVTPDTPTATAASTAINTPARTLKPTATVTKTTTPTPTATATKTTTPTPTATRFIPTFTPTPTSAFRPTSPLPPPTSPSLGDTWIRPADGMLMVYVPDGEFEMGSNDEDVFYAMGLCAESGGIPAACPYTFFENEQPVHTVTLDSFWIDRTEVTNAQYQQCVEAEACQAPTTHDRGEPTYADASKANYPVFGVDWLDAYEYCMWTGARLPTEAEWEYAARGPDGNIFPWGDAFDGTRLNSCDVNCTYDWINSNYDDGYEMAAPAESFETGASWCGALNMAGNVSEWVADWYDAGYYARSPTQDPRGADWGTNRVRRGGSWDSVMFFVRATSRMAGGISGPGFRCAVSFILADTPPSTTSEPTVTGTPQPTATPTPGIGHKMTRETDGMVMVHVPGGQFKMGSWDGLLGDEQPVHTVTLDSFWIDRTEVTNAQYQQCVEAEACQAPTTHDQGEPTYADASKANYPVVVNWLGAYEYCMWTGARLPTEAEWEYAARGPDGNIFPWGDAFDGTGLNFCDVNCTHDWRDSNYDDGYEMAAPAESFETGASWCGALNMAGNVSEWTSSLYRNYPYQADDGREDPTLSGLRVLRGGSWSEPLITTRSDRRAAYFPFLAFGFRCVTATLEPPTPTLPPPSAPVTDSTVSLIVTHSPNPARVQKGSDSGYAYTCAYTTTVKAVGGGVRIEEFGSYERVNDQWVLNTFTGEPIYFRGFC